MTEEVARSLRGLEFLLGALGVSAESRNDLRTVGRDLEWAHFEIKRLTDKLLEAYTRSAEIALGYGYTLDENRQQPWARDANAWLRTQNVEIAKRILELANE